VIKFVSVHCADHSHFNSRNGGFSSYQYVIFQVVTAASMKIVVFWAVAPCSQVDYTAQQLRRQPSSRDQIVCRNKLNASDTHFWPVCVPSTMRLFAWNPHEHSNVSVIIMGYPETEHLTTEQRVAFAPVRHVTTRCAAQLLT
jgi:hypothetical protein